MILFPSNPTVGQQVTQGNKTWDYNGFGWDLVSVPDVELNQLAGAVSAAQASRDAAAASAAAAAQSAADSAGSAVGAVRFNAAQTLTSPQQLQARTNIGLSAAENKSSATIRGELTEANVNTALGITVSANGKSLIADPSTYTGPVNGAHTGDGSALSGLTKTQVGLPNAENKSSATIRSEITSGNVTAALGFTPINATLIGANSGLAQLDSGGKVPAAQLPSYVDDVLEFANLAAFPGTGESGKIYTALDTNKIYRWSGSVYVEISGSPGTTDAVVEGVTNLYFTVARVLAAVLTGFSTASSAVVTAADTVLSALGKLQAQISLRATLASPTFTGTVGGITATMVGLGSVNNTADTAKPVSTAQQAALDAVRTTLASNAQTGTAYTGVLLDAGKRVKMNNAAANVFTVPPNSSVAYPVDTVIYVAQTGAGATSVAAGAGVTVNTATTLGVGGAGKMVSLIKEATDTWTLYGGAAA